MTVFPVFVMGIGILIVGAVVMTVYVAFKGIELP